MGVHEAVLITWLKTSPVEKEEVDTGSSRCAPTDGENRLCTTKQEALPVESDPEEMPRWHLNTALLKI